MINLMQLPANEAERLAYAEGFTGTAELFARLSEAEHTIARYEAALKAIVDGGRLGTMTAKQCAGAAREVLP
jgi:hypothetical protein